MSESQKPQNLTGRLAIVTGCTRGIGLSITRDLLSRGASVLGTFINSTDAASSLSQEASTLSPAAKFHGIQASILDASSPSKIASAVKEHFPDRAVDIVVLNAAVSKLGALETLEVDAVQQSITGNLVFPLMLVKELLPLLSKSGTGRIIAISSEGANLSRPNTTVYSSTKAGLESMVRTWSKELGRAYGGLTANAVAPGLVETDLLKGLDAERRKVWEEKAKDGTVSGRIGRPEDVAGVVGWLAGDESRWVTGTTVAVNGGMFDL